MPEVTDTSLNNSGNGNTDAATVTSTDKRKFEFDTDEQKFIQGIIDKSVGKVHGQYKAQIEALQTQLDELTNKGTKKDAPKKDENVDGDLKAEAQDKQFKELLNNEKNKAKLAEQLATQKQKELDEAKAEAMRIRKEVAIQKAAAKQNFYELDVVTAMTDKNIEWDADSNSFVIKENGIIKQNSSLQPMSLEEYYASFAAQRPYLVNGDVVSGAGSKENSGATGSPVVRSKADLKTTKDKVEFIKKFGLAKFEALPQK